MKVEMIKMRSISLCHFLCLFFALSIPGGLLAEENPSNPLAKSVNTDIRAQYFDLRDGSDLTAARLIGLWSLSDGYWGKLDAKVPYDWGAGLGLRFVY
jgi:hypothetical protein